MKRSSTRLGSPAFGMADTGSPRGSSFSTAAYTTCGPSQQFTPMTSQPSAFSRSPIAATGVPSAMVSASSTETCAITGRSRPTARRTPSRASSISSGWRMVSIMSTSTPPSASAAACSRNASRTRSRSSSEKPAKTRPVGPMAPATNTRSPATLRASRAAATFSSCTRSSSPWRARRTRLAPKLFVSITWAPARR